MPWSRVFTPPDTHADPTGDCDRACAVRAFVEHGIYRCPLRHAVHRAVDFSGGTDGFAVAIMAALLAGARRPNANEIGHSLVAGSLVHGLTLGGAFTAISQGVPAGISALILGLQPIVTSALANRFMGEKITRLQSVGLGLGLVGVLLVLHDRNIVLAGSVLGWVASFLSLIGITLGTLYQKRYCGGIDWRTGNLVQYVGAGALVSPLLSSCLPSGSLAPHAVTTPRPPRHQIATDPAIASPSPQSP
jgi:drug/metabolite transporter (DMT)-like permease